MRIACGVVLSLLMLAPADAQAAHAQTDQEQAQIAWALERGRLIFSIDRAAWVATDDMMERINDPAGAGLRGYIVEPGAEGFEVIFYAGTDENLVQAYRGQVRSGGVASRQVFPPDARPPLTPSQTRLVHAIKAIRRTELRPCGTNPFNPIVVPPAGPLDPIDVYLMTPQVDANLPIGGHHRVTVAANGTVAASRSFTNSCLAMPPAPPNSVGLGVTHLLDKIPTEIHVFTALAAGVPLFVGTNRPNRTWEVTGQHIRLVGRR